MKNIYFIRHAKSSWESSVTDHERPLNPRGFHDADNVGKALLKKGIIADVVYSSTANRAETTAKIICENIGYPINEINFTNELYDFEGVQVLKVIKELADDYNSAIIVGHNSAFSSLVNTLGSKIFFNFPTCGVAAINFDVDKWDEIEKGETEFYILPKELR